MIDKLDLRIPRRAAFTPTFHRLYRELRTMEKGLFRPSKYYEYAGDLREYGFNVRLSLYCQMDKLGNHKLELVDVGRMSRADILREVCQIFDIDPLLLGVMRVDFAVDLLNIALQWFRETVWVDNKRFRAAVTGQPFYSEMGKGNIQTLYFGKRPNLIRIYDKLAEYWQEYQTMVRWLGRGVQPPSFESVYGSYPNGSNLTRVERQIGSRIPNQVATLRQIVAPHLDFNPFEKLKIIDHAAKPERDCGVTFETYCTGMYLRGIAESDGMQAVKAFISKESNGNSAWAWKKYGVFLTSAASGITEEELQSRFEQSLALQMSA